MEKKDIEKRIKNAGRTPQAKSATVEPTFEVPKLGVKETKEAFDFGFDLAEAGRKSLEDGKVNFLDVPNFIKPLRSGMAAVNGIQQVKNELLDLDLKERKELEDHARTRLNTEIDDNDKLVEIISEAISISLSAFVLADKITTYRKDNEATA